MNPSARTTLSLDEARLDGWFDRVAEGSSSFEQLCAVLGVEYVAFAVIVGVRVSALTLDRARPSATLVEFSVRDTDTKHELPLIDLQRRLCTLLLEDDGQAPPEPRAGAKAVEIQQFLGPKYVLLASFFGIELLTLHVGGADPATVRLRAGTIEEEVRLDLFREIIRARVRQELSALDSTTGFQLDMAAVEASERAAAEGKWAEVSKLVGSWPGPLAQLIRSREGASLAGPTKARIARTLMNLSSAQEHRGDTQSADDTLRLAVQYSQDTDAAGAVFAALGRLYVARAQHGQAIGFFRRALSLGADSAAVLPLLAISYADRGRFVAAAVCADQALRAGAPMAAVSDLLDRVELRLGAPWRSLRDLIPAADVAHAAKGAAGERP